MNASRRTVVAPLDIESVRMLLQGCKVGRGVLTWISATTMWHTTKSPAKCPYIRIVTELWRVYVSFKLKVLGQSTVASYKICSLASNAGASRRYIS